jgi:phosphoenolpyruvate-protein phosphotransferase (PTS system enzyme I)
VGTGTTRLDVFHVAIIMIIRSGIAVSPGVAIGEALIIDQQHIRVPRRFVSRDAVDDELLRLTQASDAVAAEMERNRELIQARLGDHYGAIFSAHLQLLRDPQLNSELKQLVAQEGYSPEHAVATTFGKYVQIFEGLDNPYLAERSHDIADIQRSLLRHLVGQPHEELAHLSVPAVVLAHDLTPSETAKLDRHFVLAFVTEAGGAGGHTSIMARGLALPALVGVGRFLSEVSPGDLVIVDGDRGQVVIRPDEATIARYRQEAEVHRQQAASLVGLRDLPAETQDGVRIHIGANIEFPRDVEPSLENGADGIGLYRTEFLYLGEVADPSEEAHYQAYAEVVARMQQRPVIIRTFDLGADKLGSSPGFSDEKNPFLGLRSIRLSLRNVPSFRVQLRAILRASVLGNVKVMFPMITTVGELRHAKAVLADAMEDLEEHGIPFQRDLPVGMMVEVPSAVIMLDTFLSEVDFLSIGTNDLIQYTLAVDRSNPDVAELYHDSDPAVLRLIEMTLQVAQRAEKPVGLCGKMSGNPLYTMLLIGLGLRDLSVPPAVIPEIKQICRRVTTGQCIEVANRVMRLESAREIDNFLREELKKVCP